MLDRLPKFEARFFELALNTFIDDVGYNVAALVKAEDTPRQVKVRASSSAVQQELPGLHPQKRFVNMLIITSTGTTLAHVSGRLPSKTQHGFIIHKEKTTLQSSNKRDGFLE